MNKLSRLFLFTGQRPVNKTASLKRYRVLSIFKDPAVWLFSLLSLLPSLRPLAKHLPASLFFIALPVYVFFLLGAYSAIVWTIRNTHVPVLFHSWQLFAGIMLVITCANFFLYPLADGMKRHMRGSDQDDALIETGQTLLLGHNPYHAHLYTGTHISPGPGIIVMALPFAHSRLYFLFTPCALLIIGLLIAGIGKSFFYASAFLMLMIPCLAFWEVMIIGSDMLAIGLLFAMVTIALFKWEQRKKGGLLNSGGNAGSRYGRFAMNAALILFTSMVATSRIIFIALIPVWGMFLFKINKRDALVFVGWTTLCVAVIHVFFYSMDPSAYTPFHVISKGKGLMGPALSAFGAVVTGCVGLAIFIRTRATLPSWIFSLALACAAPLAFVSLGDFFWQKRGLAGWEGVNYLFIFIPLFYLYYVFNAALNRNGSIQQ